MKDAGDEGIQCHEVSPKICCELTGEQCNTVPTVSEWGLIVVTLLGMTLGTIMLARRRKPAVA